MKLLFDENLSHRLVSALRDSYAGSAHVRDLGLLGAADRLIWKVAADRGFLLIRKIRTSTSAAWCMVLHRR